MVSGARTEGLMDRIIRCECGFIARGRTDEAVVEEIRSHMKTDHPALYEQVPVEDIRGWIEVD